MKNIDKYRGCLIGGAAGDALGYAVEFLDDAAIFSKYGENGITEYSLVNGVAEISDDTQMTLFTANALLLGTTRGMTRGIMGSYPSYISLCYKEWLRTQYEQFPLNEEYSYTWLINVPELFARRAPGNTCISAIENGANGTLEEPINRSKGCGGIMRVAPIGLYFEGKRYSVSEIDKIGAETAALTHGHELGYIPAAALVHILHILSHNEDVKMLDAVLDMKKAIRREFVNVKHLSEQIALIDKAIDLANEDVDDLEAIRELGQGWVAEETLAIAIYCALKYSNDFDKALIASVNHSGDSDSTGAVTGNILGAYLGLSGIPEKYLKNLELKNVILEFADDLFNDCKITEYGSYHDEIWEQKYIYKSYRQLKENNRGVYGIFLIRCDDLDEQCAYIGKSEQLFERAKQHLKSIENRTNISSLNNAMDDDDLRIEIRLIESVEYKFDNYYKDAQRLASRENHWIDEYQEKNQCLEQVPEGKRPSIESWERQKEKYKNRSNKS